MTTRVRHDDVRAADLLAADLLAADHLPTCPTCGDLCAPEATVCECGQRLTPSNTTAGSRAHLGDGSETQQKEAIMAPKCSCEGRGLCTVCVLAEYESGRSF